MFERRRSAVGFRESLGGPFVLPTFRRDGVRFTVYHQTSYGTTKWTTVAPLTTEISSESSVLGERLPGVRPRQV